MRRCARLLPFPPAILRDRTRTLAAPSAHGRHLPRVSGKLCHRCARATDFLRAQPTERPLPTQAAGQNPESRKASSIQQEVDGNQLTSGTYLRVAVAIRSATKISSSPPAALYRRFRAL